MRGRHRADLPLRAILQRATGLADKGGAYNRDAARLAGRRNEERLSRRADPDGRRRLRAGVGRDAAIAVCRGGRRGSSMHGWDAKQYLRFADERAQPALDLLARIDLATPRRIVDLGCGPGNSTGLLRDRWPEAAITGLDSSADMLAAARRDHPGIEFVVGDIASWAPAQPYDLVFSNAALQWVGNHEHLLPQLIEAVVARRHPRSADAPQPRFRDASADAPSRGRGAVARQARRRTRPLAGQTARILLR